MIKKLIIIFIIGLLAILLFSCVTQEEQQVTFIDTPYVSMDDLIGKDTTLWLTDPVRCDVMTLIFNDMIQHNYYNVDIFIYKGDTIASILLYDSSTIVYGRYAKMRFVPYSAVKDTFTVRWDSKGFYKTKDR